MSFIIKLLLVIYKYVKNGRYASLTEKKWCEIVFCYELVFIIPFLAGVLEILFFSSALLYISKVFDALLS